MISKGSWVTFVSPEDGKTYTGQVETIRRDGIATIAYEHDYFGTLCPQHEYLKVLRLTPAAKPVEVIP
jgi:hypothetical protein